VRESILSAAIGGANSASISVTALAMVNSALRAATFTKIAVWSALALAMGGVTVGLIALAGPRPGPAQPVAHAGRTEDALAPKPDEALDQSNDRLPDGALARLGSVAFNHGAAQAFTKSLTFSADGKHLISKGGGWVRRWEVESGKETTSLGDGWI
jgi:hypothetical protein